MITSIHIIKNHTISNLNRNEYNTPKTAFFGGVQRGARSSQNIKYTLRHSDYFKCLATAEGMESVKDFLAFRVRNLKPVIERYYKNDLIDGVGEENAKVILAAVESLSTETEVRVYAVTEVKEIVERLLAWYNESKDQVADIGMLKQYLSIKAKPKAVKLSKAESEEVDKVKNDWWKDTITTGIYGRGVTFDIALFGRMVAGEAGNNTEGALCAAHSITTHEVTIESDFFTAVDEFSTTGGSAHMGNAEFDTGCFYEYVSIDTDQLIRNLSDYGSGEEIVKPTLKAVLQALAYETSHSKQNSMASNPLPSAILVEEREDNLAFTYTNAFEKAIMPENGGYIKPSVEAFKAEVEKLAKTYDTMPVKRYWLTTEGITMDESVAINCKSMSELLNAI